MFAIREEEEEEEVVEELGEFQGPSIVRSFAVTVTHEISANPDWLRRQWVELHGPPVAPSLRGDDARRRVGPSRTNEQSGKI